MGSWRRWHGRKERFGASVCARVLVVGGALSLAGLAGAVDYQWANPAGGAWSTATNWQPAGVPSTAADSAYVPVGGAAFVIGLDANPYLRGCLLANPTTVLALNGHVFGADRLRNQGVIVANQGYGSTLVGGLVNEAAGVIRVEGGGLLAMYGAQWRNDGTMVLPSGGAQAACLRVQSYLELAGDGDLVLQDSTLAILDSPGAWTLTNGAGHTIRGAGSISAPLVNHGRVDADRAGEWLLLTYYNKTNDGVMAATGGGVLRIAGITLTNTGGTLLADGGAVRLENAVVGGGSLASAGGGEIVVLGGVTLVDPHLTAQLRVAPSSILALAGSSCVNEGLVRVLPAAGLGAVLRVGGNVTVSGGGAIEMNDAALAGLDSPGAWVLTNAADHAITGAGVISAPLVNHGLVSADRAGGELLLTYYAKTNDGTLRAVGGGQLRIAGITLTNTGGSVLADGGAVQLENAVVSGGSLASAGGGEIVGLGAVTLVDPHLSGQLRVAASSLVALAGSSCVNEGLLRVVPAAGMGAVLRVGGNVTVSGGGAIEMNDAALAGLDSPGAWVLTNAADHAITGAGTISAPLVNHGLVSADRPGGALLLNYFGKINDGTLRATGGGQLRIAGIPLTNTGGTVLADGGPVQLEGCAIDGGTLATSAGAVMTVQGATTFTNVVNTGRVEVAETGLLALAGQTLANEGTLLVHTGGNAAAVLRIGGYLTVGGHGAIELNHPTLAGLDSPGAWTLTNAVGHRIRGAGVMSAPLVNEGEVCGDRDDASLVLTFYGKTNNGVFAARSGGRLTLEVMPTNYNPGNRRLTGGSWQAEDGGVVELRNCPVDSLAADVVLDGVGSRVARDADDHDALAGLVRIAPEGSLTLRDDVDFASAGAVVNAGRLVLGRGSEFAAFGPGFTQTAGGTYRVELAGSGPGACGLLAVAGQVSLAGSLEVALAGGFRPAYGDSFVVMVFDTRSGAFADPGPVVADGMILAQVWRPHALVLRVIGETAVGDDPVAGIPAQMSFVARRAQGGATVLALALPAPARVEVAVFDVAGRKVATVARGEEPAGVHEYGWTGAAAAGGRLASGVYVARAQVSAGGKTDALTTKVVVVR